MRVHLMLLPVIFPCETKNHESEDGFVVDVKRKVELKPPKIKKI